MKRILAAFLAAALMLSLSVVGFAADPAELPLKEVEIISPGTYVTASLDEKTNTFSIQLPEELKAGHINAMLAEKMTNLVASGSPDTYRSNVGIRLTYDLDALSLDNAGYYYDGSGYFQMASAKDDFLEYWWPAYYLEVRSNPNDLNSDWKRLEIDYSGDGPEEKSNAQAVKDYYTSSTASFGDDAASTTNHGVTYRFAPSTSLNRSIEISMTADASQDTVIAVARPLTVTLANPADPTPTPVADDDDDNIAATDNDANTSEAKDAIRAGETVEVELRNSAPAIALDTMNLLGANEDAAIVASIGDMTVAIPGGFGRVTEAGRIYYPLGFRAPSRQESDMEDFVPAGAEFETVEAGGSMTMPAAVTVTLETDLEGTVHVYLYDEDADRVTYIASPVEEDGKVTFTTTRLGHFLLTSEKI